MSVLSKLYYVTLLLIASIVLTIYISALLGNQTFLVADRVYMDFYLSSVITITIFFVQFYLFSGIVLNTYGFKLLKFVAPYIPLYIIIHIIFEDSFLIVNSLISLIYWLILSLYTKSWISRSLIIFKNAAIFIIYIIVMTWVRTEFIFSNNITIYQVLILSIDPIFLLLILYGKEMMSNVGMEQTGNVPKIFLENIIPANGAYGSEVDERSEVFQQMQSLLGTERLIASAVWIGQQILSWLGILIVSRFLGNIFLEVLILTVSYAAYGYVVRYRLHFKWCTIASGIIFFVSARVLPGVYYTQLLPVMLSLFLVCCSFKIALYINTNKERDELNAKLRSIVANYNSFNLTKYCDYNQMKDIAEKKGLNKKQIQILKLYYCEGATWAKINVSLSPWSESTIRRQLLEAREMFNRDDEI